MLFSVSVDKTEEELLLFSTDSLMLKVKDTPSVLADAAILNGMQFSATKVLKQQHIEPTRPIFL